MGFWCQVSGDRKSTGIRCQMSGLRYQEQKIPSLLTRHLLVSHLPPSPNPLPLLPRVGTSLRGVRIN